MHRTSSHNFDILIIHEVIINEVTGYAEVTAAIS